MQKRFGILVALFSLSFLFCLSGIAMAEENPISPPSQEIVSKQSHSSIVVETRADILESEVSLIKQWSCGIEDQLDGTVTILGYTNTYNTVQYLDVKVYLQRWNGSNWVDLTSRTYSDSNNLYVSGSTYITVQPGYYYRTRSVHTAQNSGNYDTQTAVCNAIYVN